MKNNMPFANEAIKNWVKSIGLVLLLFVVVYAPTSAVAHRPLNLAVPLTIVVSLGVATGLIAFFIRCSGMSIATFGFRGCSARHIAIALALGLLLGIAAAWSTGHTHEAGPLTGLSIPVWLSFVYFGAGAPIQEEIIFRGLLQSTLARSLAPQSPSGHAAPLIVAVLFGAIHIVVGPVTAICAFVLGMVAGELRHRSGSVMPAVVVHALFNFCGIVWMLS